MASKRKRGRGLLPRAFVVSKSRLRQNLQKIEDIPPTIPPPEDYGTTMENIRKDSNILFNYAKTPEDKLKYIQIIFKIGQMYLWYPWKVGALTDDKGREYILAKAMQAEQGQYTFIDILRKKGEKEKRDNRLKQTLDKLGATDLFFKKPHPAGLKIRIPRRKPKPVRDYEEAQVRRYKSKIKLMKFINLHKRMTKIHRSNKTTESKKELKLARERWERSRTEYLEAKRDLPKKEKAYEKWKNRSKAPKAKAFKKK